MATNKFLIFNTAKANMQDDTTYSADSQRTGGLVSGQARAVLHNKLFRQLSVMVYAIAELIKNKGIQVDDSDPATLVSGLETTIQSYSLTERQYSLIPNFFNAYDIEQLDYAFSQTKGVGSALKNYSVAKGSAYTYAYLQTKDTFSDVLADNYSLAELLQDPKLIELVNKSDYANTLYVDLSSIQLGKAMAILAGLNPASYADMSAIVASSTAMNAIVADADAIRAMAWNDQVIYFAANSATAMSIIAGSANMMDEINDSDVAISRVFSYATAINAITGNTIAFTKICATEKAIKEAVKSTTFMNSTVASTTLMDLVMASNIAISEMIKSTSAFTICCGSAIALNRFIKNNVAKNCILAYASDLIQTLRSTITATMTAGTTYFTKAAANGDMATANTKTVGVANSFVDILTAIDGSSSDYFKNMSHEHLRSFVIHDSFASESGSGTTVVDKLAIGGLYIKADSSTAGLDYTSYTYTAI